jgi:hypothetical protein
MPTPRRRGDIAHPLPEPLRVLSGRLQHLAHGAGQGRVLRQGGVALDGGVYGRLETGLLLAPSLADVPLGIPRGSRLASLLLLLVHGGFDLRFALMALFSAEHAAIIGGPATCCQPRCLRPQRRVPGGERPRTE